MKVDRIKWLVRYKKAKRVMVTVAIVNLVGTAILIAHSGKTVVWAAMNPEKVEREIMRIDRLVAKDALADGRIVSPAPDHDVK